MESVQILSTINTEENIPHDWLVFPLLRQKVLVGIFGWIFGVVFGSLLFALMAPIMIPHNYLVGVASAIFTTIILGIVLFVAVGSLWQLLVDILRLRHAGEHVIIITPEDFVKQEGKKIIHVPLEHVRHVTARGTLPPDRSSATARLDARPPTVGENIGGLFMGRRAAESGRRSITRRRMRTPTTLAFIDGRTDSEVVVVNDKAYGDPFSIAALLKQYASRRQESL